MYMYMKPYGNERHVYSLEIVLHYHRNAGMQSSSPTQYGFVVPATTHT